MSQAFSVDDPGLGKPRLRLMPNDGSETFRSVQSGAVQFGSGCFMALRNPAAHEHHDDELPEQEALEQLAAFSILARWVDQAAVVQAE